MRTISIIILTFGLIYGASNMRDELRGRTDVSSPESFSGTSFFPHHASTDDEDSNFRGAMIYHWFSAAGLSLVGIFGLMLCRRYDRLDPLSPDFRYPDD